MTNPAPFDFDDALDDVLSAPIAPRTLTASVALQPAVEQQMYLENCRKCGGSGSWRGRGPCFACKGKGRLTFKTSPEQRAAGRESAARKTLADANAKAAEIEAWKATNPVAWAWMQSRAERFDFARSMVEALEKFGSLTVNQHAAVDRLAAKDAERDTQRAAEVQARAASAPAITVEAIETAFRAAQAKGVKRPKLRLDVFTFSLAPANGKNAGSIYVTEKGEKTFNHQTGFDTSNIYLGKVTAGRFHATRECADEKAARIVAVASDPAQAAIAYGRRTGECAVCGRTLTVGLSIDRGIGPICFERMGW